MIGMSEYSCLMQSNNKKDNDMSSEDHKHKIVFLVWDRQSIRASGISKHSELLSIFYSLLALDILSYLLKLYRILRKEKPR